MNRFATDVLERAAVTAAAGQGPRLTGQLANGGDTVTVNSFTVEQWA